MRYTLNLARQVYLNRRKLFLAYAVTAVLLFLVLLAQANFWFHASTQEDLLRSRLATLENQLGLTGSNGADSEVELNDLLGQLTFANGLIAKESFRWTELLGDLESVAEPQVRITEIRPDFKNGSLQLAGQAKTVADLRQYLDTLIASPVFSKVYLLRQDETESKGLVGSIPQKLINFSLVVEGVVK